MCLRYISTNACAVAPIAASAAASGCSNSRCLTIWYASSEDAGRHWSATRRTTFCSRLQRLQPVRAADLLGVADGGAPSSPSSDAGIEITSSTPEVPLAASVSDCAKVNWRRRCRRRGRRGRRAAGRRPPTHRSGSRGRVLAPAARAAPRRGGCGLRRPRRRARTPSAPPSCQASSPQIVLTSVPSALVIAGRAEVVADDRDPVDLSAAVYPLAEQQLLGLLREVAERQPGRDVPQRRASSGSCRHRSWSAG